jgi:hypothetical protein
VLHRELISLKEFESLRHFRKELGDSTKDTTNGGNRKYWDGTLRRAFTKMKGILGLMIIHSRSGQMSRQQKRTNVKSLYEPLII